MRYQRICDFLWLLTGLAICVGSYQLNLGTLRDPGPGLMPFGTGLSLFLFSLPALFRHGPHVEKRSESWMGPHWRRVVGTILSLSVYGLVLTRLGYLISTFLLLAYLFYARENRGWAAIAMKALVSSLLTYFVFDKWLDCQLPKGILGF